MFLPLIFLLFVPHPLLLTYKFKVFKTKMRLFIGFELRFIISKFSLINADKLLNVFNDVFNLLI